MNLPLHETVKPLTWLEGKWKIENHGSGKYPTIKDFNYCGSMEFINIGPVFNYAAQTWHPESKRAMHYEKGFLKVIPETNKVYLNLAHNFGLTTIEQGEIIGKTINFKSIDISRREGTKPPAVTQISRELKLNGDCLEQVVYMATSNTPDLTEHLRARYIRVD